MRKLGVHLALWLGLFGLRLLLALSQRYAGWGHGPWRAEIVTAALFALVSLMLVLAAEWRAGSLRKPRL